MLRTLYTLYQRDVGIDVERLLALDVTLPDARTRGRRGCRARHRADGRTAGGHPRCDGCRRDPVAAARRRRRVRDLRVEGRTFGPNEAPDVAWRAITPGYFDTVGAPILRGRALHRRRSRGRTAGRRSSTIRSHGLWPGADPIGARIGTGLDGDGAGVTVVGIVADIPQESLRIRGWPEMYRPLAQPARFSTEAMALVVRTDGDPRR